MPRTFDHSDARAHWGLILGFAAMLLLMIALSVNALRAGSTLQQRMHGVVAQTNLKTALITTLRATAHERLFLLQTMLLTEDPATRDAAWQRFESEGERYARAHQTLLALPLSATERVALEAQSQRILIGIPLQQHIGDLILVGGTERAQRLLLDEALPLQTQSNAYLAHLIELQEQAAAGATAEADDAYAQTRALTVLLGSSTFILGVLIAWVVVRRSRRAAAHLFGAKERAQVTLQTLSEGVITADHSGRITYLNSAAARLTGHDRVSACGQPMDSVFVLHGREAQQAFSAALERVLGGTETLHAETNALLRSRSGERLAIEYSASPLRDREQRVLGLVLVLRNVSDVRSLTEQLSYQASHDALTQLFNRREFERRLQLALDSARARGVVHALCYLDLDQFKVVNDTCGHVAGDELLKQLAVALALQVRSCDVLARLGGDEFGVLLEEHSLERALEVAQAMQRAVTEFRFAWEKRSFQIGVSIGVVAVAAESGNLADVLKAADSACYVAKEQGRNRIHVYQVDDHAVTQRRGEMEWMQRITEALREDRFCLYAQDIVPLRRDDLPRHREILVRMLDAQGDTILPQVFVPAAERYNLMPAVDRWVISHALHLIANMDDVEEGNFAINLSGQSLCDDELLDYLTRAFQASGVDPHRVCFEITETAAITNLSRATRLIRTLRNMGCQFALDDFGCGLSSFTYLKNLPVDFLKIDGAFVRDMANDAMDRVLVEYINEIGHVLGFKTIAEYVDSDAVLILLKHMGVDYVQGYGVARPVPLTELFTQRAAAAERREGQSLL